MESFFAQRDKKKSQKAGKPKVVQQQEQRTEASEWHDPSQATVLLSETNVKSMADLESGLFFIQYS